MSRAPREVLEEAMRSPPVSPEDAAEFKAACAREMARAEARRNPTPQLDLDQAA